MSSAEREKEIDREREISPKDCELEAFSNAHLSDAILLYMNDNKKLLLSYAVLLRKRKKEQATKPQRLSDKVIDNKR